MTYQQQSFLKVLHTLSQRCDVCYEDYLYDKGGRCEEYERLSAIVPDGIEEPGIPTGGG